MARRVERDSLFLAGVLTCRDTGVPCTVRVRNLSSHGLMAEGVSGLGASTRVSIALRGVGDVPGEVIWVEENRIGIRFDTAVDPVRARMTIGRRPLASRHAS